MVGIVVVVVVIIIIIIIVVVIFRKCRNNWNDNGTFCKYNSEAQ